MKTKIICILVMMLLIIAAISAVNAVVIDKTSFRLTNDDYNCLNKKMSGFNRRNWSEQGKLLASDGRSQDRFGLSVSTYGDYTLIGAYFDDDNGECSGSAYVFKRDGNNWSEHDKLIASDGATYDQFGYSVSIYEDYALIGTFQDDDNGVDSGSAYVFKRDGNNWMQQAKLMASDGIEWAQFGCSVSIYGDYALIGARFDDDIVEGSGSAYVFKRDGNNWMQQAKLMASDGAAGDHFGYSVSIYEEYALIGAISDDDNLPSSGSAYVFKRDGNNWSEQDKIIASDGTACDYFGNSVSIYEDYALIAAFEDDDNGDDSGSAYVFKRDGNNWSEQAKLLASDGAAKDIFGYSVSIYEDYALIGAHWDDDNGNYSGSAFIFKRDGYNWIEQAKLLASDGAEGDEFGCSVSMYGDTAMIGASWGNNNNGYDTGSAYAFILDNEPPNAPIIDGPTHGKPGVDYNYTFISADPEGDDVWYHISWGDKEVIYIYGPYPSSEEIILSYNWTNKGTYFITCWARDIYDALSNTTKLEITIPRNKAVTNNMLLQRLLEKFPLLHRLSFIWRAFIE